MHKYTHKLIRTYSILKHTHTHLFISVHLYADIMIFPTPSHMPKHLCHTCTLPFPVYTHTTHTHTHTHTTQHTHTHTHTHKPPPHPPTTPPTHTHTHTHTHPHTHTHVCLSHKCYHEQGSTQ